MLLVIRKSIRQREEFSESRQLRVTLHHRIVRNPATFQVRDEKMLLGKLSSPKAKSESPRENMRATKFGPPHKNNLVAHRDYLRSPIPCLHTRSAPLNHLQKVQGHQSRRQSLANIQRRMLLLFKF